jgi:hypothetical protein
MIERFDAFQLSEAGSPAVAQSPAAATYMHPDDVVSDEKLTTAEKRAVLASWISDARAVEDAPALRRLESGAVVEVDAILRALVSLDGLATRQRAPEWPPSSRRGPSEVSSWLSRGTSSSSRDDDDDPPPTPAGFGIPFRPTFVAAHGELPLLGTPSATRMKRMKDGKARQRLTHRVTPRGAGLCAAAA